MSIFQQAKIALVAVSGLSRDALHIYVALIVFFGSCLLFGWKAGQWKPWLLALLAAIAGESMDIHDAVAGTAGFQGSLVVLYFDSVKDLINTLTMPTMILLAMRFSRMFRADEEPDEL